MLEKITLVIFLICMPVCASLVLSFIWMGGPQSEVLAQVAASNFVIGLASFLLWFVLFLYKNIAK